MSEPEERLREALLATHRSLAGGDFLAAARELDEAMKQCAQLAGRPFGDAEHLVDLARGCLEVARVAAIDLEQALAEVGVARIARAAYRD